MKLLGYVQAMVWSTAAVVAVTAAPAFAQDGPNYVKQPFGFNGCTIDWAPLYGDVSLDYMVTQATEMALLGFTMHPDGDYGHFLQGAFPKDCRSAPGLSWPLYLAEGHVRSYARMSYGFNGCDVTFGPNMEDTDEEAMIQAARLANAVGFTYQDDLHFGAVIIGAYPEGCEAPVGLSWPLYLDTGN